jgi:hypothetical protein
MEGPTPEEIAAIDEVWDADDQTDLIDAVLLLIFEDFPTPPDVDRRASGEVA